MQVALYIASVIGAVALLMMMPRRLANLRLIGAILGAATLGGLWLYLALPVQDQPWLPFRLGAFNTPFAYYYVFSFIAIAASARVITSRRPVYAALWFIMVVLASAGLFLVLSAEFMAFALVIIYGGAILVTYMFVIMLASHAGDPTDASDLPEYDRIAQEPLAAVAAGFVLLAVLLGVAFPIGGMEPNAAARGPDDQTLINTVLNGRSQKKLERSLVAQTPQQLERIEAFLAPTARLDNVERVGLDLFRSHPLGLELAGIILLVALIGAVVIARTRVEDDRVTG